MKISFFTITFLMIGSSFSFSQELTPPIEIYTLTSGFGDNDSTRF